MSQPFSEPQLPAHLVQQCLRWAQRRYSYRPAGEPFDPSRYGVEPITNVQAKAYVEAHHYSASYPAARFRAGLFEQLPFHPPRLVGVAVFGVPMTAAVLPKYLGAEVAENAAELSRLVVCDSVPANGESFMLARAFKLARREKGLRGIVSFCDPVARYDAQGRTTKRSHTGVVYRAHNAHYAGRTLPRTLLLMPNGVVASERALSKIRGREQGYDYAVRQLMDAGAPARMLGEEPAAWLHRLRDICFFTPVRHPGNHAFTWIL